MSPARLRRCVFAGLLLIAALVFFAGINWGLPSRSSDRFLFGDVSPWSGQKIMQLAGDRPDDARLGANVPTHVLDRSGMVPLNETDADRARIIRRYRLYSEQPDENTLLMAIGRMKPGRLDFDPHFYQYGGWFVYPVAGMLKLAGLCGYLKLTPDIAYYIDHPEQFGRFYIVARSWAAIWGLVGVWAVFWIGRRMTGNLWSAAILTLAYIFMPVVINQAHEAKPHLQAAVLTLLAVIAAFKYIETGNRRYAWLAGGLCGAAFGSVLYMAFALAVLPVMAWRRGGMKMLIVTSLIAIGVYVIGNPYVAINLLHNREVLRSNLGNSTEMYHFSISGVLNSVRWLIEGITPGVAVGVLILPFVIARDWRAQDDRTARKKTMLLLLFSPFVFVLMQYLLLGTGKPAEYGRFAIYPDIVLSTALWGGVRSEKLTARGWFVFALVFIWLYGIGVAAYGTAFCRDTTRLRAAQAIAARDGGHVIGLWAEPAPYSMPPVDLFRRRLFLFPLNMPASPSTTSCDMLIAPTDDPSRPKPQIGGFNREVVRSAWSTPMSWANKSFEIYFRNTPPQ
jgi:4-amino-4-deoxy-L-arabinose transferase-like glycosyltransferase